MYINRRVVRNNNYTALTPEWLKNELKNIFGSSISALYLADDYITTKNDLKTLQTRTGGPLKQVFPTLNSHVQIKDINNRKFCINTSSTYLNSYTPSTSTINYASIFVVTKPTTLPFTTSGHLVGTENKYTLQATSGSMEWVNQAGYGATNYRRNGIATRDISSDLSVYQVDQANTVATYCFSYPINGQVGFLGETGLLLFLSSVPTLLQRLRTQYVLDQYYRPDRAQTSKLALDLYQLFGASMIGLYIGEDLVVDGSNNVTSWPSRIGPTATANSATLYQKGLINNRNCVSNSTSSAVGGYNVVLSVAPRTAIVAARAGSVPFSSYASLFFDNPLAEVYLIGNNATSSWFTSGPKPGTLYKNGLLSTTVSGDLQIYQSDLQASTDVTYLFGAQTSQTSRNWIGDLACYLFTSNVCNTEERLLATQILRNYYNI